MNAAHKLIQLPNPLEEYREVVNELKALEKAKEALKAQIFSLMDQKGSDFISYGNLKAERSLVVQERLDPAKVKSLLGNQYSEATKEIEIVRLAVM